MGDLSCVGTGSFQTSVLHCIFPNHLLGICKNCQHNRFHIQHCGEKWVLLARAIHAEIFPIFSGSFFFSSSSSIFSMAQVRFKVDVPETLDYTPREAIEDSITLVRGLFTAGWRTTAHA